MKIKNTVKFFRKQSQLTQKQLAQKAKISERQVIEIEKGYLDPRTSTSLKLARMLDTTVEELFPDSEATEGNNPPKK